jgi:hypothetical protein
VVFPKHSAGERYVGDVIEFLSQTEYRSLDRAGEAGREHGIIEKDGTEIYWNQVARRTHDGSFECLFGPGSESGDVVASTAGERTRVFHRLARSTDRPTEQVEREFERKRRYVRHLVQEGYDDFEELFRFIADLRANEAATVERVQNASRDVAADGGDATEES